MKIFNRKERKERERFFDGMNRINRMLTELTELTESGTAPLSPTNPPIPIPHGTHGAHGANVHSSLSPSTNPESVYSAFRIPHYCETGWLGVKKQRLKTLTRSKAKTKTKDRLTKARRSWNMSRITGKNTKPEMIVRSMLHRMGYRFRLHDRKLPGCPDIVLPKNKTVIFVHGCFWHRHKGCKNCTTPTNRREWWLAKLNGNAERDKRHRRALIKLGWKPIVVWECKTDKSEKVFRLAEQLSRLLRGRASEN